MLIVFSSNYPVIYCIPWLSNNHHGYYQSVILVPSNCMVLSHQKITNNTFEALCWSAIKICPCCSLVKRHSHIKGEEVCILAMRDIPAASNHRKVLQLCCREYQHEASYIFIYLMCKAAALLQRASDIPRFICRLCSYSIFVAIHLIKHHLLGQTSRNSR